MSNVRLSLADFNKIKYIQHKQKQQKKKQKVRPLQMFSKKYYHSGYKFSNFVRRLDENKPFSYVRYNDGEVQCLFGRTPKGVNSDKHQYFPEMRDEMLAALNKASNWKDSRNGTYLFQLGIWMFEGSKSKTYYPWVRDFLVANKSNTIKFLPKDPFVRSFQSYPEIFKKMVEALNKKHVVMVGPEYMKDVGILSSVKHHVVVPERDCYLEQDRIQGEIEAYAAEHDQESLVFIFSSSMMTNTLIDRLHPKFKGKHFLLDCGSIWNNFIPGKQNRGYMTKFRKKWQRMYPQWIL